MSDGRDYDPVSPPAVLSQALPDHLLLSIEGRRILRCGSGWDFSRFIVRRDFLTRFTLSRVFLCCSHHVTCLFKLTWSDYWNIVTSLPSSSHTGSLNVPHHTRRDRSVGWCLFHFFKLAGDAAPLATANSSSTKASDVNPICKPKLDYSPLHTEGLWGWCTENRMRCRKWTLRRRREKRDTIEKSEEAFAFPRLLIHQDLVNALRVWGN